MSQPDKIFCSDIARELGDPLTATATRGDLWFLVEYSGRYEGKAFEESSIPEEVKSVLKGVETPGIKPRVLLIRQDVSHHREGLHFFVAQTHPLNPRLYQFHLQEYTDILEIDLSAMAAGQPGDPSHLRVDPLFLICTNGKRDLCCARYGPEIYQALAYEEFGESVWQSSHIGGHNKAPNNLFFPHGVNYGRSNPANIHRLVSSYQAQRIWLEHYRGRVCYDPPVQAAEHFWRQETGILDLPGMELVSIEVVDDDLWQIAVQGVDGNHAIIIGIRRYETQVHIPLSCTQDKLRSISTFHRVS